MHRQWVEQQQKQQLSQPQEPQDPCLPSAPVDKAEDSRHRSSASYASTNSSFLIRHFPMRVFILKSMTLVSRRLVDHVDRRAGRAGGICQDGRLDHATAQ